MNGNRPLDLIPGSGRPGASRSLPHVVSVRFEEPLLDECRQLATSDGMKLSEWVRSAALREVRRRHPEWVCGWRCGHVDISGPEGTLTRPSCSSGCDMEPVYGPQRSGIGWPV